MIIMSMTYVGLKINEDICFPFPTPSFPFGIPKGADVIKACRSRCAYVRGLLVLTPLVMVGDAVIC